MQRNHKGISTVHTAALNGNLHVFKYFISECNCYPAGLDLFGLTPLHLEIVKYLVVEIQMDPLCECGYGNTVLHSACTSGHGCQAVVVLLTAEVEKI